MNMRRGERREYCVVFEHGFGQDRETIALVHIFIGQNLVALCESQSDISLAMHAFVVGHVRENGGHNVKRRLLVARFLLLPQLGDVQIRDSSAVHKEEADALYQATRVNFSEDISRRAAVAHVVVVNHRGRNNTLRALFFLPNSEQANIIYKLTTFQFVVLK